MKRVSTARPGAGARAGLGLMAVGAALSLGTGPGCRPPSAETEIPATALVVTQVPVHGRSPEAGNEARDALYPAGSRVVLVAPGQGSTGRVRVLSEGLHAAGGPVVGPDRREVLFVGLARPGVDWQIYRARLPDGKCQAVTEVPGGAMEPAWLPADRFVFVAPVARSPRTVSSLYTLSVTGGVPARLTFGLTPASDPTVLSDGRILFVSAVPGAGGEPGGGTSLFTVNNDGTEIVAYAGQHDGPSMLRRPRESADGRVVFLSGGKGVPAVDGRIEQVLTARPFRSRTVAHPSIAAPCRSVEPDAGGALLATLCEPGPDRARATFAVYRLAPGATRLEEPVYDDPAWDEVEAVVPSRALRPMGRLSSIDEDQREGVLLCLDANLSSYPVSGGAGARVRVSAWREPGGGPEVLGETAIHADGSFMTRVPSDTPLTLEVLDAGSNVLRRCPPAVWVRPGENRACVGCHEPHNRAPENGRPLAVRHPPARLRPTGRSTSDAGSGGGP